MSRQDAEVRGRVFGASGLAGLLLLAGCGSLDGMFGDPVTVDPQQISGLRSDPDQRGLVVSYLGGACDGRTRLLVSESSTRVELSVQVQRGSGSCIAMAVPGTVSARLDKPVGERSVWAGGREHVPFDGVQLLVPSALPTNFIGESETGFSTPSASTPPEPVVTATWVTRYLDADTHAAEGGCRPSRGSLEVRIGPTTLEQFRGRKVASVEVGTAQARLYRDGSAKKPVGWSYVWAVAERTVTVASATQCAGDRPLGRAELLEVAESLGPAR